MHTINIAALNGRIVSLNRRYNVAVYHTTKLAQSANYLKRCDVTLYIMFSMKSLVTICPNLKRSCTWTANCQQTLYWAEFRYYTPQFGYSPTRVTGAENLITWAAIIGLVRLERTPTVLGNCVWECVVGWYKKARRSGDKKYQSFSK